MLWVAGGPAGFSLYAEPTSSAQQAHSEVSFCFCPHTCAVAGTHSKPLTKAKVGDLAGLLRFA